MSIDELIEHLENAREEIGGDSHVRFAQQPSWPFEYTISDSTAIVDGVLYLAEGSQLGYLSGEAARELGWK